MKQTSVFALILVVSSCAAFGQSKTGTFTGEIMDKQCAQMSSHENMMKEEGAKDGKQCTLACVKNGDTFVLLDSATKKVYVINDEKKVREFAGERVNVTGSYDQEGDVLRVKTISRAK